MSIDYDPFETEKILLQEVRELIKNKKYDKETLLEKFNETIEQFDKTIRDVEKIIKISDGQQGYLHKIQGDLKKEIEERIRAEERLKYIAAIDSLTGCYNRGMGLTFLENEIKSIKRNKNFFSICYIDINELKHVNDNYGHLEGDELIILICKFIKEVIRDNDIICRLGGDEFLILFPNITEEYAGNIMRKVINNIDIENKNILKPYNISFSYGIFQVDYNSTWSIDEIIQKADIKMYKDKEKYKGSSLKTR
ncbi:GGDEF domain-containing protein [Clostridium thailandense]|uniref:GGDEF domain-containing protein n=1 Tax=Clostridium thailandense TaxID=2794346 RepID=UPI003989AA08